MQHPKKGFRKQCCKSAWTIRLTVGNKIITLGGYDEEYHEMTNKYLLKRKIAGKWQQI